MIDARADVDERVDRAQGVGEQVVPSEVTWVVCEPAFDGHPADMTADLRAAAALDEFDVADPGSDALPC